MSEIILALLTLALIVLVAYREMEHAKQVKELIFLIKSKDEKDFESWKAADEKPVIKEEPSQFEEVDLADLTPEQVKEMSKI